MVEASHRSGFLPGLVDPFRALGARVADWFAPAAEASAGAGAYTIRMEVPGVVEGDIDITVHDGLLTVKGEKHASRAQSGDSWFFSEREFGAFARSFRLPPDADEGAVAADLKDGVLSLSIPKQAEMPPEGARKVEIGRG